MLEETDISKEKEWLGAERARVVVNSLQKNNINAKYVSSRQEALDAVMDMIPPGAFVARADSVSLDQVGVVPKLLKRNQNRFLDPLERNADGYWIVDTAERVRLEREALTADVFLTGTNAITLDGKLVSTDGHGNRVSAMIFGPKKVIIVAGVNKIVEDVDDAFQRIREVAAPMNSKRHHQRHHFEEMGTLACVRAGRCIDCHNEWRLCRYTVIIQGAMFPEKGRINVVLVGEDLGL